VILLFYFAKPLGIAKSIEEDLQLIIHRYKYYFLIIKNKILHSINFRREPNLLYFAKTPLFAKI
jgi:hypothetical protein